ncbi:AAA family ATPase [Tsukamurella spumae]|uniref:AAA family ATPase n=1 Tax=Tsukamurella spumae TaxID=44753 RepID=A0A846WY32_9ACTN|nr:AAA family ATPase [Tsukamurella spumae]NKY17801.1 AAA family ATPase [Tsukamurella spumae]
MTAEHTGVGRQLRITRGTEVRARRIRWLIEHWIPLGALTLLAGREGLGKSTIACWWAAWITRMGQNIVYIHTEDSREHTVAPRLRAAGADMDRVLFIDVATDYTENGNLVLPLDNEALEVLCVDHDVKLVVLDAATSAMHSSLSGKDDRQVRQFLEPLSQMAARLDIVVLGLVHFGKRDGDDSGKLILGSIAWSQVARSVLSVAADDDAGHLVVTNTKGNLATRTHSEACRIVTRTIDTEDGSAEIGAAEWIGEVSTDARDLLAGDRSSDHQEVDDWLRAQLKGGRVKATELYSAADAAGHSKDGAKRAKKRLGVLAIKDGTWWWELPSQGSSDQGSTPDPHARSLAPLLPSRSEGVPREHDSQGSKGAHEGVGLLPCAACGFPITAPTDVEREQRRHDSCIEKESA